MNSSYSGPLKRYQNWLTLDERDVKLLGQFEASVCVFFYPSLMHSECRWKKPLGRPTEPLKAEDGEQVLRGPFEVGNLAIAQLDHSPSTRKPSSMVKKCDSKRVTTRLTLPGPGRRHQALLHGFHRQVLQKWPWRAARREARTCPGHAVRRMRDGGHAQKFPLGRPRGPEARRAPCSPA